MVASVSSRGRLADDILLIARIEIRRAFRKMLDSWVKLAALAVAGLLFLGPILLVGTFGLVALGGEVASGSLDPPDGTTIADILTGASAVMLVMFLFIATMRSATNVVVLDEPDSMLLSTPLSAVVGGLVLTEFLLFSLWILPPTVILAAAFAFGAGTVVPVVVAPLVVAGLLGMAVSIGFLLGLCIRHLVTAYEPIAKVRTPLAIVLSVGYVSLFAFDFGGSVMEVLFRVLGDSPAGWPGYVLALSVPGVEANPLAIAGAVVSTVLVLGGALSAAIRVGGYHWFADPAGSDDDRTTERISTESIESLLGDGLPRPIRVVTVTTLLRAKRAPIRLLYVAYPLFGALYTIEDIVSTGAIPPYVAVVLCLYAVWAVGALFTLNLLGDIGPALPSVLTSTASGRDIVVGTMLASALVGVPLSAVVSVTAGLLSPLSLTATAILATATIAGSIAAPALATGIGTLFPRFGEVRVATNREEVMPSKTAFLLYSVAVVLPATGAAIFSVSAVADVFADFFSWVVSLLPGISVTVPPLLVSGFGGLTLLLAGITAVLSGTYAARKIDRYRPY